MRQGVILVRRMCLNLGNHVREQQAAEQAPHKLLHHCHRTWVEFAQQLRKDLSGLEFEMRAVGNFYGGPRLYSHPYDVVNAKSNLRPLVAELNSHVARWIVEADLLFEGLIKLQGAAAIQGKFNLGEFLRRVELLKDGQSHSVVIDWLLTRLPIERSSLRKTKSDG